MRKRTILFLSGLIIILFIFIGIDSIDGFQHSSAVLQNTNKLLGSIFNTSVNKIAFAYTDESLMGGAKKQIAVIDADGKNLIRITDGKTDDRYPVWAPSAKEIAYIAYGPIGIGKYDPQIFIVNPDGTNNRKITSFDSVYIIDRMRWSPDGEKIAFIAYNPITDPDNSKLFVIDRSGKEFKCLLDCKRDSFYSLSGFAWSPDGAKIIFGGSRDEGRATVAIYEFNINDHKLHNLTSENISVDVYPYYSPDGKYIAFSGYRPNTGYGIYVMNADGSNQTMLIKSGDAPSIKTPYLTKSKITDRIMRILRVTWSPDGSKIAFSCSVYGGGTELWVMDSDGKNLKFPGPGESYSWSPDSQKLAFDGEEDMEGLVVVDLNSRNRRLLSSSYPWDISWSPK